MARRWTTTAIPCVAVAVLCGQACRNEVATGGARAQEIDAKRQAVVDEARRKRETRIGDLRKMDTAGLARELANDSEKGREPFNSMAFDEIVSRGESAARDLAPLIKSADRSSLLALLALRRLSPTQYKQLDPGVRVKILVDALRTAPSFNTWGLPHLRWEDAARALIEEGPAAEVPLRELMKDKRDAPVWGGEDAAEYSLYRYRVCDYAWAILNAIAGRTETIPQDPAARDLMQLKGTP